MKRLLLSFLAALSLLALSSCSTPLTDQQRLAANGTHVYLSSAIFSAMEEAYEKNSGTAPREPVILHAMEYQLNDLDGIAIHGILIALRSDIFHDGQISDSTYLFIDLPSSTIYDDKGLDLDSWRKNFSGTCQNSYDALSLVFDRYAVYVQSNSSPMISETERCTVFTQEEIAGIMQSLADRAAASAS